MYIWTGIHLDDQLADLRRSAQAATDALGTPNSALLFPLHVSLRISFDIDDALAPAAVEQIADVLRSAEAFTMLPQQIEQMGDSIVWLSIAPNDTLTRLHETLVSRMQASFGVPPHPFDMDYRYHASLFMGERADEAYALLKDAPVPAALTAQKFVIGVSETGQPEAYRIVKEITAPGGCFNRA